MHVEHALELILSKLETIDCRLRLIECKSGHDDRSRLAAELKKHTDKLAAAVAANESSTFTASEKFVMAQPILDPLAAQIAASDDAIDSAVVLVNGIQKLVLVNGIQKLVLVNGIQKQIADAVTAALAGGATAAQLAPFTDLNAALKAKTDALAAAVAANTPAAP